MNTVLFLNCIYNLSEIEIIELNTISNQFEKNA